LHRAEADPGDRKTTERKLIHGLRLAPNHRK
jgi:hypothetical protein